MQLTIPTEGPFNPLPAGVRHYMPAIQNRKESWRHFDAPGTSTNV